jgi:hypothetical protein
MESYETQQKLARLRSDNKIYCAREKKLKKNSKNLLSTKSGKNDNLNAESLKKLQ